MWWLLWVAVVGVVAAALLIAYLVDRRGRGTGMTDRDRNDADSIMRDHETQSDSWRDTGSGMSSLG